MFKNIMSVFKKMGKKQDLDKLNKDEAKERLHLVLLQDRANVSADFLEMMKQEIIEVIKKYIEIDEKEIDVKLTNKQNSDGTTGAPALYANIPIVGIKSETRKRTNKIKLEELGNNENNIDVTVDNSKKSSTGSSKKSKKKNENGNQTTEIKEDIAQNDAVKADVAQDDVVKENVTQDDIVQDNVTVANENIEENQTVENKVDSKDESKPKKETTKKKTTGSKNTKKKKVSK